MRSDQVARNTTDVSVLSVTGLTKTYRQGFFGRRGAPAVEDLTFRVEAGEIFALLGHNGAGKTTTMKAILGLVRADCGAITVTGRDARHAEARRSVGYLPESPHFHENLTARELLDFFGRLLGLNSAARRQETARCLERVGMQDFSEHRMARLSKGMRQRVGLAQALLGQPRLLILDEPQSGLDPLGRRLVRDLLLELKDDGTTIVFSSHIVPDVMAVADRVATMRHGRLVSVRQLDRSSESSAYRVEIAAPPATAGATTLLDEAPYVVTRRQALRWQIAVRGTGALGQLLGVCEADALAVFDVGPEQAGFEDELLAGLRDSERHPEVASC